jgi:TatD DNase family protein
MLKYIDIHSHVNFTAFDADRDAVIKRALDNDTWVINVGTQIDTSKSAVALANKYGEGVYAIIGLHPIHTGASYHDEKELGEGGKEFTSRGEIFNKEKYRELLKDPKVLGIGECGLDYYRCDEESISKQKEAFITQIELANEFNKPLMLHIRNNPKDKTNNAYSDALALLKEHSKVKGDVHFFAGNWEEAKAFLDFGFTLSFTGVITFTHDYDEVIRNTPLDMLHPRRTEASAMNRFTCEKSLKKLRR